MQIGKSLYIDLEIEDLNKRNFLNYNDVVDLQIIETAGTSLPVVYMSFITQDYDIANYFIPNNKIKVKLGETENDADTFLVDIYKVGTPSNDPAGTKWSVEFSGFIMNKDYMVNMEMKAYWGNSLLVAKQVLSDYFGAKPSKGFQTSIFKTNENQVRWRRNNQTACTFLAETLVHMDIYPGFPLFAFDKYGTFHLNDFNTVALQPPVAYFVPYSPRKSNEIQYLNTLSIENLRDNYNLYSGFNKMTEIYGITKGVPEYVMSDNSPVLAATQESEKSQNTSRSSLNVVQSSNVHNTYVSSFVYNTNKLVALSSMTGVLRLAGKYYRNLKPTDVVSVSTGGDDTVIGGLYLIDTIRIKADMSEGMLRTFVYITRDNKNNVENYIANPQQGVKIRKKFLTDLLNAIGRVRVAYAMGKKVVDGTFMGQLLSFALMTKNNLLRSFNVAGVAIDFTSSSNLIKSLVNVGNSLMNTLTSLIFPANIAGIFRDFIIRKPSLKALLYNYVAYYVPYEVRDIITIILDSLFDTTDTLNSIAKDNKITVAAGAVSGESDMKDGSAINSNVEGETVINNTDTSEIDYTENNQERVGGIISDFENNTTGLDIPFPIIELTESQSLMPDDTLRNYVAQQTINNLTNLGYLDGFTDEEIEEFKEILLGEKEINFNMIDRINKNAGNSYNYRLWGTYSDLIDLTSFYIKKCYKDKYRTIPCTKLINATDNIKIFFACPSSEEELKFYINSKRTELNSFEIDLGYTDVYGNIIPYTVYYTENGFNSTSVLFEIKQGGMV